MITFNEEFINFREIYTVEKLYLKNTYSQNKKSSKFLLIAKILMIFGIYISLPLFDGYRIFGIGIASLSFLFILAFIYKEVVQAREELKNNNLPFSKCFYEWKTEELENLRIKHINSQYGNIDSTIILKRIDIAEGLLKDMDKDIFSDFEKITEFFGKNYILLIIGLFIGLFNKAEYTNDNFRLVFKVISFLMLVPYLAALSWKYSFKKNYMAPNNSKKEQYRDYIFVMKNILLMR